NIGPVVDPVRRNGVAFPVAGHERHLNALVPADLHLHLPVRRVEHRGAHLIEELGVVYPRPSDDGVAHRIRPRFHYSTTSPSLIAIEAGICYRIAASWRENHQPPLTYRVEVGRRWPLSLCAGVGTGVGAGARRPVRRAPPPSLRIHCFI